MNDLLFLTMEVKSLWEDKGSIWIELDFIDLIIIFFITRITNTFYLLIIKWIFLIQPLWLSSVLSAKRQNVCVLSPSTPPAWVLVFSTAVKWRSNWIILSEKTVKVPKTHENCPFVGKGSFINVLNLRLLWKVQTINSTSVLRDRKVDDNVKPPRNTGESRCHWKLGQKRKILP